MTPKGTSLRYRANCFVIESLNVTIHMKALGDGVCDNTEESSFSVFQQNMVGCGGGAEFRERGLDNFH